YESEYDDFLYAPICEEKNGMSLSVLSALARRQIDPWEEAALLADLPEQTAADRLAALIGPQPAEPVADIEMIAARLITLLPRKIPEPLIDDVPPGNRIFSTLCIFLYLVIMLFAMNPQWIVGNHLPLAQAAPVHRNAEEKIGMPAN
ncbi:MAG: hypothetical protein WCD70_07955, partial [Alphaproteobacteria bacterium]